MEVAIYLLDVFHKYQNKKIFFTRVYQRIQYDFIKSKNTTLVK